jgi:hypothetical protein
LSAFDYGELRVALNRSARPFLQHETSEALVNCA